jgi:BON domain
MEAANDNRVQAWNGYCFAYRCMRAFRIVATAAIALGLAQAAALAQSPTHPPQPVPDTVPGDQTPNGGVQPAPPGGASGYQQNLTAHHLGFHHYNSDADEANDALLITEVKSAIAKSKLGEPYAITVDADHGLIILTGEVPDAGMAGRLERIASGCDGVKGVQSHLDWPAKAN